MYKNLDKLLRERRFSASGKDLPVILVDTSAIIDIGNGTKYNNQGRRKGRPVFRDAYDFLNEFGNGFPLLVIPEVCEEVTTHSKMKLNGHVYEIGSNVADLVCEEFQKNFERTWLESKPAEDVDPEGVRLLVYWTAQEACDGKKAEEEMSETDKKILHRAAVLSQSYTEEGKRISPVGILTSDEHILAGTRLLRKNGFYGIYTISTRT